ncbi:MAG: response regulator [Leptolyngbyaceae bacterium]|nr:response regulator [Leptolyngbyaceae bacterium]
MPTKCILLIDDQRDIHTVVELSLTMTTSWQVIMALSGEEGVAQAVQHQPDAILLDAMMPVLDGVGTFALLQARPETQQIPVIFLTGKGEAGDRRQFYALGAKGMIMKPFEPQTLASQIAGFLGWEL